MKSINSGSGVGTTLRSLLATRIHPKDPNDDNEEYYLVKPIRKPWKTDGESGSTVTMDVKCVVCGCGDIQFSHVKRNESQIEEYILSKACNSTITTMGDIHAIY